MAETLCRSGARRAARGLRTSKRDGRRDPIANRRQRFNGNRDGNSDDSNRRNRPGNAIAQCSADRSARKIVVGLMAVPVRTALGTQHRREGGRRPRRCDRGKRQQDRVDRHRIGGHQRDRLATDTTAQLHGFSIDSRYRPVHGSVDAWLGHGFDRARTAVPPLVTRYFETIARGFRQR